MGNSTAPTFSSKSRRYPPSLRDWLLESDPFYFVSDVVDQLDLSAIEKGYEKERRG